MKSDDFDIKDSLQAGVGKGLFAKGDIKKGAFILEYTGIPLPTKEADEHPGRYLFEVDEQLTINGEPEWNTARYINHSCEPNVEAEVEDGHINIYATRPLRAGEELYIDYGDEYFDEFIRPAGCRCGSRKCRTKLQAQA